MVELITNLHQLTKQIIDNLEQTTFEQLVDFVAERDEIITALQSDKEEVALNAADRETLQTILEHDQKIMARMNDLREEAATAMHKIKQGQSQKDTYESPYSLDGIYFDKKK